MGEAVLWWKWEKDGESSLFIGPLCAPLPTCKGFPLFYKTKLKLNFFFFWSRETYLRGAAAPNQEQPETVLVE